MKNKPTASDGSRDLTFEMIDWLYYRIDWVWVYQTYRWCQERNFRLFDKACEGIAGMKAPKRGDNADLTI